MMAKKETNGKNKSDDSSGGFSDAEKKAMKERSEEIKRQKKKGSKTDEEAAVLEKISEMKPDDKTIAIGLHELIKQNFPMLGFRTWYGFPAYTRDGKVITFFQPSGRFNERYSSLGFSEDAKLDDGVFWPTSYALVEWNDQVAAEIKQLMKKALEG